MPLVLPHLCSPLNQLLPKRCNCRTGPKKWCCESMRSQLGQEAFFAENSREGRIMLSFDIRNLHQVNNVLHFHPFTSTCSFRGFGAKSCLAFYHFFRNFGICYQMHTNERWKLAWISLPSWATFSSYPNLEINGYTWSMAWK